MSCTYVALPMCLSLSKREFQEQWVFELKLGERSAHPACMAFSTTSWNFIQLVGNTFKVYDPWSYHKNVLHVEWSSNVCYCSPIGASRNRHYKANFIFLFKWKRSGAQKNRTTKKCHKSSDVMLFSGLLKARPAFQKSVLAQCSVRAICSLKQAQILHSSYIMSVLFPPREYINITALA